MRHTRNIRGNKLETDPLPFFPSGYRIILAGCPKAAARLRAVIVASVEAIRVTCSSVVPGEFYPCTSSVYTLDSSHVKYQRLWPEDCPILFRTAGIGISALLSAPEHKILGTTTLARFKELIASTILLALAPSVVWTANYQTCWFRANTY